MTAGAAPTPFDTDTAVTPTGPGRYTAELAERWNVVLGPNGGYLAAVIARAMTDELDDPGPRVAIDHGALPASARVRPRLGGGRDPALRPVAVEPVGHDAPGRPPDLHGPRRVLGAVGDAGVLGPRDCRRRSRPRTAGWIRTAEPRPLDPIELVAISDALPPAIFPRVSDRMAVPTIDLTVHVRATLPLDGLASDDRIYAEFTTDHVADGFIEEDGTMWAPDGTLLAQSRQLAIAR